MLPITLHSIIFQASEWVTSFPEQIWPNNHKAGDGLAMNLLALPFQALL